MHLYVLGDQSQCLPGTVPNLVKGALLCSIQSPSHGISDKARSAAPDDKKLEPHDP
jgi:hypothetical protein